MRRRWQFDPREPGPFLPSPDPAAGNTRLQCLQRDRHPGQKGSAGGDHALLEPVQADAGKAQAAFPVGIDAAPFTAQADGITLQIADQHSDRDDQQQPINSLGAAQPTALQLEDPRFLVAEELLAAESLAVSPDQIKAGIEVADEIPGFSGTDADGPGQHQIGPVTAIPEPYLTKPTAVTTGQAQPPHLTPHWRGGAVNPSVCPQSHHIAPARLPLKPTEQFGAGKGPIRQDGDRVEPHEQSVGPRQQGDHHLGADTGTGMLQRLPEQWNGSPVADHGERHNTEAVPEHRGVERQMQGLVWLLPLLHRPEHQRAVEALGIDPPIAEPTPAAPLPAGWQATVQRDGSLPLVKTDGLAEEQPGDHPAQQHQVTFVADGAVLTQEAGELNMEPGMGIHEGLAWCRNPNLSWLHAHPMA